MTEDTERPESEEVVQQIRTEEPQPAFGEDEPDPDAASDATATEQGGPQGPGSKVHPGLGGYAGRDPKTDMPMVPNVEETQHDPKSHDAQPDEAK